ncbi:unnamed protein product [Rotaria socialis]|uniref:Uncharacterized protein n=1 Tax=Rotaria socialis TaxID=392032 RepID=A0A820JFS4_9BILA|nr:unnamed protein product [Rotaria socialis]CAF4277444.1 unnamed protein product [Rotaria socialis]CAF4326002.1 unnamed protein product [Rotaria socialis]CAF4457623.1 unnamed protein product [Rotaria socialis]
MASPPTRIYNVQMDQYAYSSTGELGSKFLAPCVAIVVVFTDNTVMIEHRSDPFLYNKRDKTKRIYENDAMNLFENIVKNIRKFKRNDCVVRHAFIVGGCEDEDVDDDKIKTKFEQLLIQIHADTLDDEEDDASDSPDTHLVYELIKAIKVLKITWSVNGKSVYVEKDLTIINDSITKFVNNMTSLNAVSSNTNNDSFITSIEENVFNRLNDTISNDVVVKKLCKD